jgi:hypothetical protein
VIAQPRERDLRRNELFLVELRLGDEGRDRHGSPASRTIAEDSIMTSTPRSRRTDFLLVAAVAAHLFIGEAPAFAQTLSKGTLSGTILSGVAHAPAGGNAVAMMVAPSSGHTVLTQVCFTHSGMNVCPGGAVVGSTLGTIAGTDCVASTAAGSNCTRFDPGVVLPPGETLYCVGNAVFSSENHCTASAVVSAK